jgi:hypothetical protein
MKILKTYILMALGLVSATAYAEDDLKGEMFNPVNTGVTTLSIAPDARGSSLGNLGAATDPDMNSQYWNSSKYAFAYSTGGLSLSYTPWLRKIVNDIFLADLSGYYKIGSGDNQAISASFRYFSLGEVTTGYTEGSENINAQTIHPYEMAIDVGYSRKLSSKFSMGVVLRYILSDLSFQDTQTGEQNHAASAFAVDLNGYFTSFPMIGRNECQFSWGFNISNVGTKVSYDGGTNNYFLPTNLKLGANFMFPLADYHSLAIGLDLNKLLVPTMPRVDQYENIDEFNTAWDKWNSMSPITGIFKSFSDAPGGAKEELQEIGVSVGMEYVYNQQFFARLGYNYEHPNKGGRSYFAFGAGFSLNVVQLDASYMLATAQSSPLDQTLRFTLTFDMDGLRDLMGKRKR